MHLPVAGGSVESVVSTGSVVVEGREDQPHNLRGYVYTCCWGERIIYRGEQ